MVQPLSVLEQHFKTKYSIKRVVCKFGSDFEGKRTKFMQLKNNEISKKKVKRPTNFFKLGHGYRFLSSICFSMKIFLQCAFSKKFLSSKMKLLRGPSSKEGFLEMCLDTLTNEISLFVGFKSKGLSQVLRDVSFWLFLQSQVFCNLQVFLFLQLFVLLNLNKLLKACLKYSIWKWLRVRSLTL